LGQDPEAGAESGTHGDRSFGAAQRARRGGGGGFLFSATPGTGGSSYLRAARRLRARDGRPAGSPQNELIIKL